MQNDDNLQRRLCSCGQAAKWIFLALDRVACDDCVPRGCACTYTLKPGVERKLNAAGFMTNTPDDYCFAKEDGREMACIQWVLIDAELGPKVADAYADQNKSINEVLRQ